MAKRGPKPKDRTGQKYNSLTFIKPVTTTKWEVKCDCGTILVRNALSVVVGKSKSCGCVKTDRGPKENLIGHKNHKLTVLDYIGGSRWLAQCECGNNTELSTTHFKSGATKSCGCLIGESARERFSIHRESQKSRLYGIWSGMRNRCNLPNRKSYHRYGGRGIRVCPEWDSYLNFKEWALSNGYCDELTLDRKNNNGDYTPENCRWVNQIVQANNTCRTIQIEFFGRAMSRADFCREFGVKYSTVRNLQDKNFTGNEIVVRTLYKSNPDKVWELICSAPADAV